MATSTTYATKDSSGMIDPSYTSDQNPADSGGDQLWNGAEQHFVIGRTTSSGFDYIGRGLVYFPLSFSGVDTLESAVLHFKQHDRSSNSHAEPGLDQALGMYVRRMLRDWGENPTESEDVWNIGTGSTYTYKKMMNKYSTSGPQNWTTTNEAHWTGDQQDDNWESIDITDIVTEWWDGTANYGVILINDSPTVRNDGFNIYTRHSSGNVPYIVLTYNSNNAPLAPRGQDSSNQENLAPISNAVTSTLTPTFSGSRRDPDAGDYITGVEIIVYADNGTTMQWDSGQITVTGSPTTFSVQYASVAGTFGPTTLLGNTFYKWKVRTKDKGSLWSPYSALQRFKTNTAPLAPTLTLVSTPANDIITLTPQFQITHNDNDPGDSSMYGYQLITEMSIGTQIDDSGQVDQSGSPVATKSHTVATLTPPLSANPWGASYRSKARTKDSNGAWGPYSGYVSFTTHATGVPIDLAPANDEVAISATPTLSGARASTTDTITSYQILLYEDNNASVKWDSGTISTGIVSGATFGKVYAGSALNQGDYYQWQARVTSSIGGTSAYSSKVRFRVPSDASVPSQTAPITTGVDDQPAFEGGRTAVFNRYQVEVYPSTSTSSNLGTATYQSGTQSATITGGGPTTFSLAAGTIPALSWNTTYKWRARVSADAGSSWSDWSGLASFTTDAAGTPTLTSPSDDEWIIDATPTFTATKAASDGANTLSKVQVKVYAANGTTELWDSTMTDVANANTGSVTYAGPTLSGGYYWWEARYEKTTGPTGNYASKQRFRLNYAPSASTELEPTPGEVLEETLLPTFRARFNDDDIVAVGDTPSEWVIEIAELDDLGTVIETITETTGLIVGVNEYVYDVGDVTLSYGTDYAWRTRFTDSLAVDGSWSGWSAFSMAVKPNSTGLTPTTSYSEIATVRPTFSFTYAANGGSAQRGFNVKVYEVIDANATTEEKIDGTDDEVLSLRANVTKVATATTYQFESTTFFQTGKVYEVRLSVQNTDLLFDDTPQIVRWYINTDAPDPVVGLSPTTVVDRSLIELDWDTATMKSGHTFVAYNVYKKLPNDEDWQYVGSTYERTDTHYDDWYAGHSITYQYRVTCVTTKSADIELESADDPGGGNISEASLDADVWMFVGADRDDTHIQELPVSDESHERIIQQESFEVLGADRKVVIRGFVLGNEGNISIVYINQLVEDEIDPQNTINETVKGRRLLDYLTRTKGPHTLKSPFGDVWDVEFEGPQYKWVAGGNLEIQLNWIETGQTSQVTI